MIRPVKNRIVRDIKGDGNPSLGVRVSPNVPSEVQSHTLDETCKAEGLLLDAYSDFSNTLPSKTSSKFYWYVLRCTYGRERKAYDFFIKEGYKAFYPIITTINYDDVKSKDVRELCLPNILFVYATFEQLKVYVYDNLNPNTKYLRFYYNQSHNGAKEPMIIPNDQMDSLMRICAIESEDKHLEPFVVEKFKYGQLARVTTGAFEGVKGIVKRYKGQQRVGLVVGNLFTVTTSYVPKDFLLIEDNVKNDDS